MEHRITHACGHEQTHHISGFTAQQERKTRWLHTTQCRTCFAAERQAAQAQASIRDCAVIAELAMTDLVGSERQIAWAATIRAKRLATLLTVWGAARIAEHPCLAIGDAKWWIDRRDLADEELLAAAVAPVAQAA